jgi:hypothetical protein
MMTPMRATTAGVFALWLALGPAATARAEPTPSPWSPSESTPCPQCAHYGMAFLDVGPTWDREHARMAGAALTLGFEWRGIGLLLRPDFQRQRQVVLEQGQEVPTDHASAAIGLGLHLSPIRMLDARVGRLIDIFGQVGFEGGMTGKVGGVALRGGWWLALGGAVRLPIPRRAWLPTVAIYWQHRGVDPDFVFDDSLTIAVGVAGTGGEPQD